MARDDTPIRRYSRPPNPLVVPLATGGIILGLLILIGIVAVALMTKGNSPSATGGSGDSVPVIFGGNPQVDVDGKAWTAKQVAEHLKARGAIVEWEEVPGNERVNKPTTVVIKLSGNRTGVITQFSGPLACEEDAKSAGTASKFNTSDFDRIVMTWGRVHIEPNSTRDVFLADLYRHLPGSRVWSSSERGTDADKVYGKK